MEYPCFIYASGMTETGRRVDGERKESGRRVV
jgi:hypothetical protein